MSDSSGIPLPVRIATLGLACLPMLYMGLWSAMIIGSFSGLWHPRLGDLDIGTAILRSAPIEIVGFAVMSVCWLAGLMCLILNRRAAILALGLACLIHLLVWLKITDGQYYSGQFGLIVILIEMLAITLAHFATHGRRLL